MTAKYQAGTFVHEIDLWQKLDSLILSAGWSTQATISADHDKVYYSTGEDGYAINYVRMAAKQQDSYRENRGFSQRLDADGYSGFINFFAYQHFPSSGTQPSDGYGEIGKFGPLMYVIDQDTVGDIRRVNLITSTAIARVTDHASNINLWPDRNSLDQTANSGSSLFDGQKFIYFQHNSGQFRKYNVSTGTLTYLGQPIDRFIATGITHLRDTDKSYILGLSNSATSGFHSILYENTFNDTIAGKFVASPPWNSSSQAPQMVGYDRYFYVVRGSNETAFARYDVLTNTWTTLTSSNLATVYYSDKMVFVTRQETGLAKHRIYLLTGANTSSHRYINVEDDGSILDASWTTATSSPFANAGNGNQPGFDWDGYDRIFYSPGASGSTTKEFYRYNISTNTWTLIDTNFFPQNLDDVTSFHTHYGLQSRVRAENSKPNQKYWAFIDKDRIVVITKDASGYYTYCYAGAPESFYDTSVKALSTSNVTSGASVVIAVNDTTKFTIGEKVQIQGVSPTDFFTHTGLDSRTRQFIRTEHFTVDAINPGVSITANNLNGDYASGSRIGADIQNTLLTVEGTRWVQALNKPATANDFASGDNSEQIYLVQPAISTAISAASDLNDRTSQFMLWPFIVSSENLTNYSGKEVRGQLKGVYVAGTGVGTSEDIIEINGLQYVIFNIARQEDTRFFVFGPIV